MRWLDSTADSVDMNLSKPLEIVEDRGAWSAAGMRSQRIRHDLATEQQQGAIQGHRTSSYKGHLWWESMFLYYIIIYLLYY